MHTHTQALTSINQLTNWTNCCIKIRYPASGRKLSFDWWWSGCQVVIVVISATVLFVSFGPFVLFLVMITFTFPHICSLIHAYLCVFTHPSTFNALFWFWSLSPSFSHGHYSFSQMDANSDYVLQLLLLLSFTFFFPPIASHHSLSFSHHCIYCLWLLLCCCTIRSPKHQSNSNKLQATIGESHIHDRYTSEQYDEIVIWLFFFCYSFFWFTDTR